MAYHGFDLLDYPGDSEVASFVEHSPFSWTGFHLGGPSYDGRVNGSPTSPVWPETAFEHLQNLGLDIAPIYCGRVRAARDSVGWQTWMVDDADYAVALAEGMSLPAGTIIFLHIDGGRRLFRAQREYVAGWTSRIDALSRFRGAAYCNAGPAQTLRSEGYTGPIWLVNWDCGRGGCPSQLGARSNCVTPCAPSLNRQPEPSFDIHQYAGDVYVSYGGVCLRVNLNVSLDSSPGTARAGEGPRQPAHN